MLLYEFLLTAIFPQVRVAVAAGQHSAGQCRLHCEMVGPLGFEPSTKG